MQARQRMSLFLLSLALALAGAAPARAAHPEYRVTVVGPPGSTANDINGDGTVVGWYTVDTTFTRAFLNRGQGVVSLGTLGGSNSSAAAINDKGQVVGSWTTVGGQRRGFIYYHGKQRDIGTVVPGRNAEYTDINNAGYITAIAVPGPDGGGAHAYLRAPDGSFLDIGNLPSDNPTTGASALNNRNQVTGASGRLVFPEQPLRAYLWTTGVMRELGNLGATPNGGTAINDRGQVAGYAALPNAFRHQVAVLYNHGRAIPIDHRPGADTRYSESRGINNLGHVVGISDDLSGFVYRGRRMESLNALVDPRQGWDIRSAAAINDAGQIAATAWRQGVQYAVRLDLIRPCLETAPALEADADDAALLKQATPTPAEVRAEADARSREVAVPVKQ